MELNPQHIATRERLILVGLYLSKYDSLGLKRLGLESFTEAFNLFGYAMGSKPASIKNYRDEFDPLFPNRRKGWHKRDTRTYCLEIYNEYRNVDLESFTSLVESFVGYDENAWSELRSRTRTKIRESYFAQRLTTGLAAEQYFESVQPSLSQFRGYAVQNTTQLGCGYDFRLDQKASDEFLVIEVKGLRGKTGSLSLTPKEYEIAGSFGDRFFLFIVKNFRESPYHEIFQNPIRGAVALSEERKTDSPSVLAGPCIGDSRDVDTESALLYVRGRKGGLCGKQSS